MSEESNSTPDRSDNGNPTPPAPTAELLQKAIEAALQSTLNLGISMTVEHLYFEDKIFAFVERSIELGTEFYSVAIIIGQTACEVASSRVLYKVMSDKSMLAYEDFLFQHERGLQNETVYKIYVAMTGNDLKNAKQDLWRRYKDTVKLRNYYAHGQQLYGAQRNDEHIKQLIVKAGTKDGVTEFTKTQREFVKYLHETHLVP